MPSRFGHNSPISPISNPDITAFPATQESNSRHTSNTQNARTMAQIIGSSPTSPFRPGHSRSISHPFTPPFSALGKKFGKNARKQAKWDSDSDSDEATYTGNSAVISPVKDQPKGSAKGDLAEAKCQTCNSTVRWPRHLKVFRCSTCLMITDIIESSHHGKELHNHPVERQHKPDASEPPIPPVDDPKPDIILSASQTRRLLDGCLSMYMDSLLDGPRSSIHQDDGRQGRSQPSNGDKITEKGRGLSPAHVSLRPPGPRDSRSRSTSAHRERLDVTKENNHLSSPHKGHWDSRDTPVRPRASSDLQYGSKTAPANGEKEAHENRPLVFQRLENYIIAAFKSVDTLNLSFPAYKPTIRSSSSGNPPRMKLDTTTVSESSPLSPVFEPDAKTLLLGDLAENSSWWMHEWAQADGKMSTAKEIPSHPSHLVSSKSPRINWIELAQWYQLILTAGSTWAEKWTNKMPDSARSELDLARRKIWESIDPSFIEKEIADARLHLQRTLMKATENLLKRPRKVLKKPEDTRFLFILLENPMLSSPGFYSQRRIAQGSHRHDRRPSKGNVRPAARESKSTRKEPSVPTTRKNGSDKHYGILKRILGLMSHLPHDCHHHFVSWTARFSPGQLERLVSLVGGFVTYRLTRQHGRKRPDAIIDTDDLVPSFATAAGNTPAELHAAINRRNVNKPPIKKKEPPIIYTEDWQIRAASRFMALLFSANISYSGQKIDRNLKRSYSKNNSNPIPINAFYNTLLDYSDLLADFEIWESKSSKFSFCQYPFFLSIWAKIHILEHDARRQMEVKAREAFFNSILSQRPASQYLVLKVRRDCIIEDSLRSVSEVVGSGQEEIKKGLRIEFLGEEGIDAGGLRKEWFLLLVREIFEPDHGLFIYDDDSNYCYFNPYCFESSEQFFLVGILLGLAIYNSTILDIDLPPFAFKKLLAASPQNATLNATQRVRFKSTLEDLAEYRPVLAKGLRMLLDYEGDVAETFCYDFVAQVDRYGEVITIPLCPGGEKRQVTNSNRREFVDLYVYYILETAVARQFEPFKRGFFTVCGGNALSLFRPEEIELLVRGSDEALDVMSLQAVATYDNWSSSRPESIPVVQWFWELFGSAGPQDQRKILLFITGSDRIPAMGATSLSIRLACLGDDCPRYPIARTCFNTLGLYRYSNKEKFVEMLWDAVLNSEGFGLK
ncbi:hypothetical protein N7495_005092 [Penicillium taxi]|uniref:uncharacterized protein n=1 Tax=Penicillium taxi TaxID=168475 RepID=UPI0025458088|nr:uncharacterized protein N7495_005092 [Penicillium taxi]KAJ5893401.1 hypothetical protein N7495_005092 [Penicillium taxi]